MKKETSQPIYKKILLKLSGEALMGDQSYGIDPATVQFMAAEIKKVYDMGLQISVVIGGGNIFRGVEASVKGMVAGIRRLYGDARYSHQRSRPAEFA